MVNTPNKRLHSTIFGASILEGDLRYLTEGQRTIGRVCHRRIHIEEATGTQ